MRASRLGAVTLVAALVVGACSSAPGSSSGSSAATSPAASGGGGGAKKPTIGFVIPLISNPYWKLMQDFAQGAAGTLGVTLQTGQADSDETKQINIIEGMIAAKVDGLVVGPVSDKVGSTVLKDAEAAGIPVVFMQRSPGVKVADYQGKQYIGYVGTDDIGGGKTAAQILYDSGARKWVAMTGAQGNSVAEDRLKAAQDFVAAHTDVKLLQSQYGNEARDAGQKTAENFLSAFPGPGFDGIYSFNDEGALGAVQALKNAGKKAGDIILVGFDALPDEVTQIKAGWETASVAQFPAKIGELGVDTLYKAVKGKKVPKNVDTGTALVTKANADQFGG